MAFSAPREFSLKKGSKYKTIWSNPASYFGPLFETEFAGSTKSHTLADIGKRVLPFLKGQNNVMCLLDQNIRC